MNLNYLRAGEYRVPALTIPEQPNLNRYAKMRKSYLQNSKPNRFAALLMTGELTEHLNSVGTLTSHLVEQTMESLQTQDPTLTREQLQRRAEELVFPETIYA